MSTVRDTELQAKECAFLEGVRRRCPHYLPVLESLGDLYTRQGKVEDGLAVDLQLTSMCPQNAMYQYNLACSYALLNRKREALDTLGTAVKLGYCDLEWMVKDKDLASINKHPEFVLLVIELKKLLKKA
jgi:hypothetical protein